MAKLHDMVITVRVDMPELLELVATVQHQIDLHAIRQDIRAQARRLRAELGLRS